MNDDQRELERIRLKEEVLQDADRRYAMKIVERIVFGILGLVGLAVVTKIITLIGL